MTNFKYGKSIDLAPRQSLALADIVGTTLRVTRGTVWITQENDTHDIVLRAGDTWMVERNGLTILEAQCETTLRATGPAFERALRKIRPQAKRASDFWRRVRARAAQWYSLTPRRPIPHV